MQMIVPFQLFKFIRWVFLFFPFVLNWAQSTTTRWEDHFSYSNVSHILEVNNYIICGAENGLFTYDLDSGEIQKNSKVGDLGDVGISAFAYSSENDLLLIGYEKGEIDILGGEESQNFLEIPLHQSYTGSKIVNHLFPYQNIVVVSGEFGLATFSLEDFEFLETVYFSVAGVYFGVKETAVLNDIIYAASDQGVYMHPLDDLIANFTSWTQVSGLPTSSFQHIVEFSGNLVAATNGSVYFFDGNNWNTLGFFSNLKDLTVNNDILSITQTNQVTNYNNSFSQIETISFTEELNTGLKIGNTTYGGTKLDGLVNGTNKIYPDGPYNNRSWSVTSFGEQIWIAPGGIQNFNNPLQIADGFYHFNGTQWIHNSSEEMLNAKDVVDIEVNPNDSTEIYVSTWFEHPSWQETNTHIGLFKFKNGEMVEHYNSQNSALLFRERVGGSKFDEEGNLWIGQSFVDSDSKTYMIRKSADGNWQSTDLYASGTGAGARKPIVYEGYAFMPLPRSNSGLKVTNMQDVYTISSSANSGNLPTDEIISAAIDKNGVLWIGTRLGPRVLYNPIEAVQSDFFQAEPIIIEQNGIPEALLTDVQINDIIVDGANQKWIATESGGVYCVSEYGDETIYHFTAQNSPLPSNQVNKIAISEATGVVYFATDKGVVSFRSDVIPTGESFGDVYAYPNPVRPGFTGNVVIKGLPNDADVRIVDVVGNLIYQTKASGGTAVWDTKNMNGKSVASGIYLVLMTNKDASETEQTKIAIVR